MSVLFSTESVLVPLETMGLLADIINIISSEYGWVVVLLFGMYQMYWPFWETKARTISGRIETKIDDVNEKQLALTQVVRALSRVNADDMKQMDPRRVDEYLVENGVEPDEFIVDTRPKNTYPYTPTADDGDSTDNSNDKGYQ